MDITKVTVVSRCTECPFLETNRMIFCNHPKWVQRDITDTLLKQKDILGDTLPSICPLPGSSVISVVKTNKIVV
jgi:hypothetical protein